MSHTPEPWSLGADHRCLLEAHGKSIADVLGNVPPNQVKANAVRIMACVNGCAGLNPAAYQECVEALEEAISFCQENQITTGHRISFWKQALAHAQEPT